MFESGTQNYRSMGESTLQWPPLGCACLNISHFNFIFLIHNIFAYYVRIYSRQDIKKYIYFISFCKGEDWNIFVKTNAMYLCTQKHKYTPKII
jgi:hypothetical protein